MPIAGRSSIRMVVGSSSVADHQSWQLPYQNGKTEHLQAKKKCTLRYFACFGPEVIKKFMLNSAEHESLNAHKYKNIKKFSIFQAQISLECYLSCSKMLNCEQIVNKKNFMLS